MGILHEGSTQTWLLSEGLAKRVRALFLPSPRAIIMFVWTLGVVVLLLHVFDYFETFSKWIIFFIFWLITFKWPAIHCNVCDVNAQFEKKKQWRCYNYFNVTITIALVKAQKRHRLVSEIASVFSGRAILEIIAREVHTKHVIALCFQPIKTLDFTQTCNKYIYLSHKVCYFCNYFTIYIYIYIYVSPNLTSLCPLLAKSWLRACYRLLYNQAVIFSAVGAFPTICLSFQMCVCIYDNQNLEWRSQILRQKICLFLCQNNSW